MQEFMSRKKLATIVEYEPNDITTTGYEYTLYADGHVAAQFRSRWQGSRSGTRYVTKPGFVDVNDIDHDDPDNDAEANLTMLAQSLDPTEDEEWHMTRRGYVIQ